MRSNAVTPCISQRVSATWRVACNNCVAQDHPRRCGLAAGAVGSASSDAASGKCYLVGAGPGPIDLLTLRAVRTLEKADVIVYDDLGAQEALAYAPAAAERVYVGKRGGRPSIKQPEIDQLLVDKCRQVQGKKGSSGGRGRSPNNPTALHLGGGMDQGWAPCQHACSSPPTCPPFGNMHTNTHARTYTHIHNHTHVQLACCRVSEW